MTDVFKTYELALEWLFYGLPTAPEQIHRAGKGLEEAKVLLDGIGSPQNEYRTVHVAGTSGKGSTVTLVSDILCANGKRVGSILSPHVYDFRERFMVDGQFVGTDEVLESINQLRPIMEELNKSGIFQSFFQVVVALAYQIFSNHDLDYVVVETGLGGLYDTTNSISRDDKVVLLNSIGLDHTEILGNTLKEIAAQKAGIISKGSVVFALKQEADVNRVFAEQAELRGANKFIEVDAGEVPGEYSESMKANIVLASRACEYLADRDGWLLDSESLERVVSEFKLPGRFERRKIGDKTIIFDGAHNPQKIQMLLDNLSISYPDHKFNVVFSSSKKRNPDEILRLLEPVTNRLILTSYSAFKDEENRGAIEFGADAYEGAEVMEDLSDIAEQIRRSDEDWLVTGSFFLVSDIGALLDK